MHHHICGLGILPDECTLLQINAGNVEARALSDAQKSSAFGPGSVREATSSGPAQMSDSMSGSLVFKLEPLAPAAGVLAVNDVVLAIEEVPIADDGTIEFRDEERVDFAFQVRGKHIGAPHA